MVKLDTHPRLSPKHRCAARKATSTEAARDDPEPKQTKLSTAETPEEENCHHPLGAHTYICLLCHWLSGKNYLQDSVCSLAHFRADARPFRHTEPDNAKPLSHTQSHQPKPQKCSSVLPEQVLLKILPFACQIPPLKFVHIFTLFFIPKGAAPRKRSAKPPLSLTLADILFEQRLLKNRGHFKLRGRRQE